VSGSGVRTTLPPVAGRTEALLKRELSLCAFGQREDAVSEAWVAHLEGWSVVQAVNTFRKRETRHRARQIAGHSVLAGI
jgi:hypothetical protein